MRFKIDSKPLKITLGIWFVLCLLIVEGNSVYAIQSENKFTIRLHDGQYLQVQVCTSEIFRIRLAASNEFEESLMERYGIIKTDWDPVQATLKTEKEKKVISTSRFQIAVDTEKGEIFVKDKNNKPIIDKISFYTPQTNVSKDLAKSLNNYFAEAKPTRAIIGSEKNQMGTTDLEELGDISYSRVLAFSLKDDERFYGGGNTSRTNIQHRGSALRMWATYKKTEIPMPFLMSSAGWAVFNNTTAKNYFDIGRFEKDNLFIFNTNGDADFYLMFGESMPNLLDRYTLITGRPYVLPKWGYGLAFGGNMMEDQIDVMNDAVRFRDENIPCDIFWLEPQWMKKRYDFSTDKNWNLEKFAAEPFWEVDKYPKYEEPTLFISRLHGLGFKFALWLCIDHDLSIAEEDQLAKQKGKTESGEEHWFDHLTRFMDQGVDGFKLDPAHTLDEHPDRKYYNGYTDKEMHNLNQVLLTKQMYETFQSHKNIRSFHHYCGGYSGSQHWGVSTSGDNGGGKNALFDQLNLGLSGFVNTSADVLVEVTDNIAGMHLGFFLPWIQVNSWYNLLHPWYMNPQEKEAFRFYAQLRNSLFPYIYSAALEGSQTGMPILRAMPLVFPDDRNVDNMIYQYMFGDHLLAGVFSDSVYLPKGNWINYWTNKKIQGGGFVNANVPENRGGPLFIRDGAIIPFQKPMNYIGEKIPDTLLLKVYPHGNSVYILREDDGISFEYEKGRLAKTSIICKEMADRTELSILPAEGSYDGIFTSRTWELELFVAEKPKQLLVNGVTMNHWEYDPSGKVYISVFQEDVYKKVTIEMIN